MERATRRRVIGSCGLAVAGLLAGCAGGSGGGGSDGGTTDGDGRTATETTTATATETATATPTRTRTTTATETTQQDIEEAPLPEHGDEKYIEKVETFPSQGRPHVKPGTDVDYERMPPLSGPHYPRAVTPGYYRETPPIERVVHSLEHGNVVVYYDPDAMTAEAEESLRKFAEAHPDGFAGVIVAPNPNEDPAAPFVLTAWRKRLRLDEYDAAAVRAFLAEYLGRGPEVKRR